MRTSGSLRSLIHGVTTDKPKVADKAYLKEQINLQTTIGSGLNKRPPLEVLAIDVFPTYVNDVTTSSVIKDFTLSGVDYLMMIQGSTANPFAAKTILVSTVGGIAQTMTASAAVYFQGVATDEDVQLTAQGDRLFVLNKTKVCAMETTLRATDTKSLIHVTNAPLSDTTLSVSFEDNNDTPYTVEHPVGTAASGRGTDVVATAIRDLINTETTVGVSAVSAGSVVMITRTDGEYANVSVRDDNAGFTLVAINGQLKDINDLPRYVGTDMQVLKIQPETDDNRNVFYMESEVDGLATAPVPPTPDGELIAGLQINGTFPDRGETGVDIVNAGFANIGSWVTKPSPVGAAMEMCAMLYNWNGTGDTRLFLSTLEPAFGGNGWPSGTFGRITIRLKSDLSILYDSALTPGADEISWGTGYIIQHTIPSTILKMTNGANYYVYFNTVSVSADMEPVNWTESSAPGEEYLPNQDTLPHDLTITASAVTIAPIDWDDKGAGDNESSPNPPFIGETITSLSIFQNRLLSLVKDEVVTTETDNTQSWWRSTMSQLLATHPVRIRSTAEDTQHFTSAIQHNKDLVLFTDKAQYRLPGSLPMSPRASGLPRTSAYANLASVKPISIGNKVFFTFSYGNYTGVSEFRSTESDSSLDKADPITDHVRRFIEGTPFKFLGDANTGELYLVTREGKIYVCDYDTDISRDEQKRWAWSVWKDFANDSDWLVESAVMADRDIILTLEKGDTLTTLVLDTVEDPDAATKQVYLDFLVKDTVAAGIITLPTSYVYGATLRVVVNDPTHIEYGNVVEYTHSGGVLTVDTAYNGVDVAYGFPFRASMKPLTQYITDEKGKINSFTNFRIQKWLAHLYKSADVYASIVTPYYDFDDQYWSGMSLGTLSALMDNVAEGTDVFSIGYKQRNDLADLELHSTGHLPMSITQLEWLGNYTSRGRRF